MKRAKTIYSGTLDASKAALFFDRMHNLKDAAEQIAEQYSQDLAEIITELSDAQSIDPALIRMAFTQERQKRKREARIAKMDGGRATQLDLLAAAAAGSESLGISPAAARQARSRSRTSESMADHKEVSRELVDAGLISEENHAENLRLADAVANKFGAGALPPHDPATGEIIEPDAHRDGGIKPESTAAMPEQGGASSKASCTHDAGEVHGRCEPTSPPKSAEMEIPSFLRRTQPAMQPAE